MTQPHSAPWFVSMHGGHSSAFCDHASSPLTSILNTAVDRGMVVFGMTEHAPRMEARFLYENEVEMGWTVEKLRSDFEAYADLSRRMVEAYEGRIHLLRGFEIEVVPADSYVELMQGWREQYGFDYCVGSVHYVNEQLFDMGPETYIEVVKSCGGIEAFAINYYQAVATMVEAIRPEIVGHLDVIRKNAHFAGPVDTPAIRKAALETLETVRDHGGILDINTGAIRRCLGDPFPEGWIVDAARDLGIPMCFGDDSHRSEDVGVGIPEARTFLLDHGVDSITCLRREKAGIGRVRISLR